MKKIALLLLLAAGSTVRAQNVENTGWFMLLNSTRFSAHWGLHLDVQVRSGNDFEYTRNVLFRPGITRYFNARQNATVGYALVYTDRHLIGTSNNQLTEHRAWEQFIQTHTLGPISAMHRFRLEQRFIEQPAGDSEFAQRFRYFTRMLLPLKKNPKAFTNGLFVALQDEVFLNIQNKEKLNNSVFDQNRFYVAGGWRVCKQLDVEGGLLVQQVNGRSVNTTNRAVQLALYTRF